MWIASRTWARLRALSMWFIFVVMASSIAILIRLAYESWHHEGHPWVIAAQGGPLLVAAAIAAGGIHDALAVRHLVEDSAGHFASVTLAGVNVLVLVFCVSLYQMLELDADFRGMIQQQSVDVWPSYAVIFVALGAGAAARWASTYDA